MSNIEKIKEVLSYQYDKNGGVIVLRFKSGLDTRRKFDIVTLQYPKSAV